MPPKKKNSVAAVAPDPSTVAAVKDDEACWYWAGDSDPSNPDKSQDIWVKELCLFCFALLVVCAHAMGKVLFDAVKTQKIEDAFKKGKKKVIVDSERFVDLCDWQQKVKEKERKTGICFLFGSNSMLFISEKMMKIAEEPSFGPSDLWQI
jgi:hypothetical protein